MAEATPDPPPDGGAPHPEEEGATSLLVLITRVLESIAVYLAAKLRLAEAEMSRDLRRLAGVAAAAVLAAILALLGAGFAAAALTLPLARWTGSLTAALAMVAGACLVLGAGIVLAVRGRLRQWGGFFPASRADLERDLEWLKRQR